MKLHWILFFILHFLVADQIKGDEGSSITAESLITEAGYPYEKHEVQTSDGYILQVHRIPYSSRVNASSPRPVVFIMHGLFGASTDWLLLGPDNALAYVLSDAGYDVWLGNARGNRFSRKHVTLDPESKAFWHFDWHQIGVIDLPDMIDYIRSYVGVDQIRYIGHSQGGTTFLVASSLSQEFNSRIITAHLLAPASFMEHVTVPFAHTIAQVYGQPQPLVEVFGDHESLRNTKQQEIFGNLVCADSSPIQFVCSSVYFFISGPDPDNLNTTKLPEISSVSPAGASINQVYHYIQLIKSRRFRRFDFGTIRNQLTYGTTQPPDYPLQKVSAPVFVYYGLGDRSVDSRDVKKLMGQLPESTLRGSYEVPFPKWAHLDFLFGTNAKKEVYDKVLADIASSPSNE